MQTKLKLSAVLLALILSIMPLTVVTANATSFDLHLPSFGLYCENTNADIHGNVKYVIDENGKAVQYSEYTISGTNDLNFKIPFISNAYELPQIDITVNQKAVTSKVCYGNSISLSNDNYDLDNIYSTKIDESITGTLYTLTPTNERLTVDFKAYDKQNFIYLLPYNRVMQSNNNNFSFTLNNAESESTYEIYALNGDFEDFESSADAAKETLSLKEYIDRSYNELKEYYNAYGNVKVEFFYSLAGGLIESHINCEYFDFFLDSTLKQRINAYQIDLQTDTETYTISYSMPVDVQINNTFKPAIYMAEQTAARNYRVDYTIELNSGLPFVIESSAEIKKQSEYIYTAKNVTNDFYFVFSSSNKPESIYGNNVNNTLKIVLFVLSGIGGCSFIVLITLIILWYGKPKNQTR